jgi:hypothetical protein
VAVARLRESVLVAAVGYDDVFTVSSLSRGLSRHSGHARAETNARPTRRPTRDLLVANLGCREQSDPDEGDRAVTRRAARTGAIVWSLEES